MENNDKYIGRMLDNRYEILEKVGSGGMAVVYKARCHRLNRIVAVKILKDELAGDADFRRRFRTESQAVAMLSHPNIVAVYDTSRSGDVEYIVMEFIDGITLKQYISRKGVLNWKEALHFASQVAKALQHAHSRGIIHRDIKPHNIMILKDGSVKVNDFGIARLQSTQNTLTQEALGSVHYISPEQAKGSHVDARSDIYSLGVVMYEMLTSHLPFEGDSAVSIAIQHISAIPLMPSELNPDIPPGLESITMHAMEPDLNLRYKSAEEMLADLEEFRKNPGIIFQYYNNNNIGRTNVDHRVNSDHRNSTDRLIANDRADTGDRMAVNGQTTREVPSGAIIKAESSLPKTARTPVRSPELVRDDYPVRGGKKNSRTSTLVAVLIISIFLIAVFAFIFVNFIMPNFNPPKDEFITIPKFVGQVYDDIINNPDYNTVYSFKPEYVNNDTVDAGVVISQDPPADRKQTPPSAGLIEIKLTVSLGEQKSVNMPDLVNHDWREAFTQLDNMGLGLNIQTSTEANNDIIKDYVIRTEPQAGTTLTEGATVFIIYSTGPETKTVKVPDVQGLPLSQAISRLEGYNLTYDIVTEENPDVPKNYVIFQDIVPETEVAEKTKVVLTVSDGPTASPSPNTSSSPPASESPSASPGTT